MQIRAERVGTLSLRRKSEKLVVHLLKAEGTEVGAVEDWSDRRYWIVQLLLPLASAQEDKNWQTSREDPAVKSKPCYGL
ncbi:hypothetical protein AVEN_73168-1 [Araneus ventricosus]|uniref:Uncharacterized protein n=1 Tax=Araneus ventricosus TaxID=182803 RepID=A0A4Y2UDZ7_ARAVE|nr:hypothetical protein AVEN_73168-1 [Araneus ventricosus]